MAELETQGYHLANLIRVALVGRNLRLGPNSMVMEGAQLQPFVTVGRNTIVWSASRVGFRSRIGDHCWLTCPLLGESTTIGDFTFIGLNATIAPSVTVGRSNVIGAGAVIRSDTKDFAVYPGPRSSPSRVPSNRLRNFGLLTAAREPSP